MADYLVFIELAIIIIFVLIFKKLLG